LSQKENLFKAIESHEFAAVVNLASDWKTFARIVGSEKAIQDLAGELGDAGVRAAVSERIRTLVKDPGDAGCERPWDAALAAYLWLLSARDEPLARIAAEEIAAAPRC
jgi:hypothetical protein